MHRDVKVSGRSALVRYVLRHLETLLTPVKQDLLTNGASICGRCSRSKSDMREMSTMISRMKGPLRRCGFCFDHPHI